MLELFFLTRHLFLGNLIHFAQRKKNSDKRRIVVSDVIKYLSTQILCHFPFGTRPTFQLAAFASFSPTFCAPSFSLTFQRSCCSWWQIVTLYQEDLRYNCTNIGETVSAIRACTITRLRPLPLEAWEAHPIHWFWGSVNPRDWNPLWGGAYLLKGSFKDPYCFVNVVVDNGEVKVVAVRLLQAVALFGQSLQGAVIVLSNQR